MSSEGAFSHFGVLPIRQSAELNDTNQVEFHGQIFGFATRPET
jgi:hypothetical protein